MADTYGEITSDGMSSLGRRVRIGPSDVFVDLGSGCGRAVLQAVEQFGCKSACGIELGRARHELALQARDGLQVHLASKVRFLCGDCAASELWLRSPLTDATVVYIASLCFDEALMQRLSERVAASPRVRTVATLKRFEGGIGGGFVAIDPPEACEMSWTALRPDEHGDGGTTQAVYIYARYTDTFDLRTMLDDLC